MNPFCVAQHNQLKEVSFLIDNITLLFLQLAYCLLHSQCTSINMKAFKKQIHIQKGKQHLMCIGSTPDDSLYFVLGKKAYHDDARICKITKAGAVFQFKIIHYFP